MEITLHLEPIHYDVEQLTHRYSEARIENAETKDLAQVDRNSSDRALVLRYVLTGTAKLRHILRDYLERKTEDANDKLPWTSDTATKRTWTFTFKEDKFDSHALAELMHWFVVRFCVWEWCKMYAPTEAKAAKDELEDMQIDLEDALVGGDMPMKERRTTDGCYPGCVIVEPIYDDSDSYTDSDSDSDSNSDSVANAHEILGLDDSSSDN